MLLLHSCGSIRQMKSEDRDQVVRLLDNPPLTGFSARASVTLGSTGPFTLSVRTRWNECIQLSYNALGLAEVAAVEFTPDRVTVISRINRVYSELLFSQIPHIDDLKADFRTIQGLIWGRMSVYGTPDPSEAATYIGMLRSNGVDGMTLVDNVSDYRYTIDPSGHVTSVSKSSLLYKASIDYSSFSGIPDVFQIPQTLDCRLSYGLKDHQAKVRYRNFSVQNGAAPRNDLSGLRKVAFSEMLEMIKSLL